MWLHIIASSLLPNSLQLPADLRKLMEIVGVMKFDFDIVKV